MIGLNDIRWLSDSIGAVYSARSLAELSHAMTDAVDLHFGLFASACEEIGMYGASYTMHRLRMDAKPPRDYEIFVHDNPLAVQLGEKRGTKVQHLRDLVSMDEWTKTDHFNGIARPLGFNDMMTMVAQGHPTTVCISLFRDTKFQARERRILGFLQPHIAAGWQRLHAISAESANGPLGVTITHDLRPLGLSSNVRQILRAFFANWHETDRLPTEMASWAARSASELRLKGEARPLRAFAAESARGRLLVRFFPGEYGLSHLIMVEVPANPNFLRLTGAGLTSRECEVMHWIALGKRDPEIAHVMGVSPKTVGKHVEHALRKLKALNRTAAVSVAFGLLQGTDSHV
jgi:DNA-binding CsgD family transcriptional regulator